MVVVLSNDVHFGVTAVSERRAMKATKNIWN
jgi:hypothetical protein